MYALKIITTTLIVLMILIIAGIMKKDTANILSFGFMELVYLLSLVCMWK